MRLHPDHPPLSPSEIAKLEAENMADRLRRSQERDASQASAPPVKDPHVERFVSIDQARELCQIAWRTAEFNTGVHGNGKPELAGNCVGKSRWLQRHLGGTLIIGFRKDREKTGRHAALLFASQGKLYVADYGEVVPVEDYPFYVEGIGYDK